MRESTKRSFFMAFFCRSIFRPGFRAKFIVCFLCGGFPSERLLDLCRVGWQQSELGGTHYPGGLLGAAEADDCARNRRMVQGPGDGDFARRASMPFADFSQAFDQTEITR